MQGDEEYGEEDDDYGDEDEEEGSQGVGKRQRDDDDKDEGDVLTKRKE